MRPTTETRHLPVTLSEEELADRAQKLAESVKEEEELREKFAAWEDTMKQAKKAHLGRIAIAHDDTVKLGEIVESGKEGQDVACTWLYTADSAFLRRDDTGELVQMRQLREDERQAVIGETEVIREPTLTDLANWLPNSEEHEYVEGDATLTLPNGEQLVIEGREEGARIELEQIIKEARKS